MSDTNTPGSRQRRLRDASRWLRTAGQTAWAARVIAAAIVTGGLLGLSPIGLSAALAGWNSPVLLTPTIGKVSDLRTAQNAAGAALAVWTTDGPPFLKEVQASFRPPGSTVWTAPITLPEITPAALGASKLDLDQILDVSLSDDGSGAAVLEVVDGVGLPGVVAWRLTPDGAWGAPIVVAAHTSSHGAQATIDNEGYVTAAWIGGDGIGAATLAPSAATPVVAHRAVASIQTTYNGNRLSIGARGSVLALVFQVRSGFRFSLSSYRLQPGATTWTGPVSVISPGRRVTDSEGLLQVATNSSGAALAAWQQFSPGKHPNARVSGARASIVVRRMTPTGTWGATTTLISTPRRGSDYSSLTAILGSSGLGAVGYLQQATKKLLISASSAGGWRAPHTVTRMATEDWGATGALDAGITASNDIVVVWDKAGSDTAMTTIKPRNGPWRASQPMPGLPKQGVAIAPRFGLSGVVDGGRLELDTAGRLAFPWRPGGTSRQIYSSTYTPD